MGLLDDLLYNASPDNGPGLLGYLNSGRTAHVADDAKDTSASALANALGLNDIGSTTQDNPVGMTNAPAPAAAPAPGAPGAPSVPISTSNYTPPAAPAPMTSPVAAPQFGANASPYLFPQSSALFGGNLPPAAPAIPPSVANANAQADDDDDDAPAAANPNAPASPIAVGGVNMPRIGSAASFTPPAAAQAAPAAAPAAPANPLAQAVQPARTFLDRTADALQSISRGGSLTGAIRGQYDDSTSKASQVANVTAQALLKAGVNPNLVTAAVQPGNGELLKSLFTQLSQGRHTTQTDKDGNLFDIGPDGKTTSVLAAQKDNWVPFQSGEDGMGGKTFKLYNHATGEIKDIPKSAGDTSDTGAGQSMVNTISQMRDQGASRADLIKQIPEKYQGYVSSLLDGKATPANLGRGTERAALIQLAHTIDPTFDETQIPARMRTAIDFTPQGKSGASIVAFNTVQHHIGKLSDDLENIGDTGWTALNALRNGIATNTPLDQKQGKAVQRVNDDIKAVTDEMSGAYKAGHVSDTEIKSWNSLVSANTPLPQMRQAISDFVDLLNGKRDALNRVHQQIMGGDASIIDKDENDKITQKAHNRNAGIADSAPAVASAASPLPSGWSVQVH